MAADQKRRRWKQEEYAQPGLVRMLGQEWTTGHCLVSLRLLKPAWRPVASANCPVEPNLMHSTLASLPYHAEITTEVTRRANLIDYGNVVNNTLIEVRKRI